MAGVHVRMIGAGIVGDVCDIAANADMIVAGSQHGKGRGRVGHRLFVFDVVSGALIRSFGGEETMRGKLSEIQPNGLRFTPDGSHILVAEEQRLSLFTVSGEYVRSIKNGGNHLKGPTNVDFTTSGEILAANRSSNSISVFSPDGSTILRTISGANGRFKHPYALAVHGSQLFVLGLDSTVVQVFN